MRKIFYSLVFVFGFLGMAKAADQVCLGGGCPGNANIVNLVTGSTPVFTAIAFVDGTTQTTKASGSGGGAGDNLGTHIATQPLNMNNFAIINTTGISMNGGGNAGVISTTQPVLSIQVGAPASTFSVTNSTVDLTNYSVTVASLTSIGSITSTSSVKITSDVVITGSGGITFSDGTRQITKAVAGGSFTNPVSSVTSIGMMATTSTVLTGVHTVSATITSGNLVVVSTFGTLPQNNYELDVTSMNISLTSAAVIQSGKITFSAQGNAASGPGRVNINLTNTIQNPQKSTTYSLWSSGASDNFWGIGSDNGTEQMVMGINSGGPAQFGMATNHALQIITNNGARAAWTGGGNFGQGTTSPDCPMSVAAPAGTSGLIMDVSTGTAGVSSGHLFEVDGTSVVFYVPIFDGTTGITVPDFVFDANFILQELMDVRLYTESNHHLPGTWSDSEFNDNHKKNGISANFTYAMQTMQKLEEAYLYIFQENDEIVKLEKRVDALEHPKHWWKFWN